MTRIPLVDDHPVVRQDIQQIHTDAPGEVVVGEAASASEGLAEIRASAWDLLVLDLTLPGPGRARVREDRHNVAD